MNKTVLAMGTMMLLMTPLAAASAHDYDHERDHRKHYRYHDQVSEAHEQAHEDGFESRSEHRAYHRAMRYEHHDFHDEHPNTWHDHRY